MYHRKSEVSKLKSEFGVCNNLYILKGSTSVTTFLIVRLEIAKLECAQTILALA